MAVIKMTQDFINNSLICPEDKTRVEFCDSVVPGMLYEVRASTPGKATIWVRYKSNGKTAYAKVGKSTEMDLAEARVKAKAIKAEIELGADPRAEEKSRLAVITFDDFFTKHYLPYVKPRKRSADRDEEIWRLRIKATKIGSSKINCISRQQIQSFHTALLEEGLAHATANHHLKLIRHALNLAVEWQMLEKNPATRIPMFMEDNKVENYLERDQLERLLEVLRTDQNRPVCLIAMFLLSTGARLNEALTATWSQVDLRNRVWKILAKNSKSRRIRSVPLNDSAIDILNQLDTQGVFDHLFINRLTGAPYTTIHRVWMRLRAEAGLPHLRIHDLRHQYASFLVNSGRTLYEVQKILGHSDAKVTERYAHLSSKSLQDAANSASVIINGAMQSASPVVAAP